MEGRKEWKGWRSHGQDSWDDLKCPTIVRISRASPGFFQEMCGMSQHQSEQSDTRFEIPE